MFGWSLVPFAVLADTLLTAVLYGLSMLSAAAFTNGSFAPRGLWLTLLSSLLYMASYPLFIFLTNDSDFAALWAMLASPLVALVLFRKTSQTPSYA